MEDELDVPSWDDWQEYLNNWRNIVDIYKRLDTDISDTRVIPDVLCHDLNDAFDLIKSLLQYHKEADIHHILITQDAESGLRLTIGYER